MCPIKRARVISSPTHTAAGNTVGCVQIPASKDPRRNRLKSIKDKRKSGINDEAAKVFSPGPFIKSGQAVFEAGSGWGVKISPEWLRTANYQKSER